jgi:hypothetical protein
MITTPTQAHMFEMTSYDYSIMGYRRPSNDTLLSRGGVCVETTTVRDSLIELWMFADGSYLEASDRMCNEVWR